MLVTEMRRGQTGVIIFIENARLQRDAMRFGLGAGQKVECIELLPAGPVVLRRNHQELAIGRELASCIQIKCNQ
ncbi:ferrous iron transport protein A [Paenibacillus sambharensis]|uniref:Ferrous iron transport protein A n=1 Tax=Paenibacillus sambharensis TaxID=1803190 RepID=A0A2W1M1E3_9BACL|nr:ferrous iron transport protein A [Paenibacillus sambharensis]